MSMRVALVIGTRPQIIKSAPIIHAATGRSGLILDVIHTGQHYDYQMSKGFFNELSLPDPVVNLGVGSGSHTWQTAEMMKGLEGAFLDLKPDVVLVPGDTNSTLAGALTAAKMHLPVAHIESGARSFDMRMPEEVNRRLTDHCSSLLFTVSENCSRNLLKEGIPGEAIRLVGDTMYESVVAHMPDIERDGALRDYGLIPKGYAVLTLHRAENVDDPARLRGIIRAILDEDIKIVYPCHPRTRVQLERTGLLGGLRSAGNVQLLKPVPYFRMLNLVRNACVMLTDSGGVQKEAFWLNTPCITLRDNTEWTETVDMGANILVGSNPMLIRQAISNVLYEENFKIRISQASNPYNAGGAANKILDYLTCFSASVEK